MGAIDKRFNIVLPKTSNSLSTSDSLSDRYVISFKITS